MLPLINVIVKDADDPEGAEKARKKCLAEQEELSKIEKEIAITAGEEFDKNRAELLVPIYFKNRSTESEIAAMKVAAEEDARKREAFVREKVNEAVQMHNEKLLEQDFKKLLEGVSCREMVQMINRCSYVVDNFRTVPYNVPSGDGVSIGMATTDDTAKEPEKENWKMDRVRNAMLYIKGDTVKELTNYVISDVSITKKLYHDESQNQKEYIFTVSVAVQEGRHEETVRVYQNDLNKLAERIEKQIASATHLPGFTMTYVNAAVKFLLKEQIVCANTVYCYKQAGWWKYKNHYRYVFDGRSLDMNHVADTGVSLTKGHLNSPAESLALLFQLEPKVIVPMLAFVVLSLMATLLEKTETPLRFTLFLYGPTGTMKTAVAKAICCSSVDETEKLGASFHDTAAAIEKLLGIWCDRVLLCDDLWPSDGELKRNMTANFEKLLRLVSEHIKRKRCNVQMEMLESIPAACGVVATGEVISKNKSSNLRIFNILFREEYFRNNPAALEILTKLQKNEGIVNALQLCVVEYVEAAQNWILQWYEKSVMEKRSTIMEQGHTEEPRLATATAQLWTAWELLLKAVVAVAPGTVSSNVYDVGVQAILEALYETDDTAQKSDPGRIYAMGIMDAISMGLLAVAKDIDVFADSYLSAKNGGKPNKYAGFYHEIEGQKYLLLLHAKAIEAVNEVQRKKKEEHHFNDKINGILKGKYPELVKTNSNNLYRTSVRGERERFLCLHVEKLEQLTTEF